MRARGDIVHLCRRARSVLRPFRETRLHIFHARHCPPLNPGNHNAFAVGRELDVHRRRPAPFSRGAPREQITRVLHVNLHEAGGERARASARGFRRRRELEDACGEESHHAGLPHAAPVRSLHRVRLAAPRLPVRKHTHVVPVEEALSERCHLLENVGVGRRWCEAVIKRKHANGARFAREVLNFDAAVFGEAADVGRPCRHHRSLVRAHRAHAHKDADVPTQSHDLLVERAPLRRERRGAIREPLLLLARLDELRRGRVEPGFERRSLVCGCRARALSLLFRFDSLLGQGPRRFRRRLRLRELRLEPWNTLCDGAHRRELLLARRRRLLE
mmetsp:Transcript_717/g.2588  ORF Transcript_717/g.2588 Transcript_717/m.2588 type:complete len:331 (+) Transcript_717:1113-2105(+)